MSHSTPTQGNINHSMRTNYNEFGVDEYYRKVNASYRNPFFPGIRKVIFALLDRWWKEEGQAKKLGVDQAAAEEEVDLELRILDMAAGSGEASLVVEEWYNSRFPASPGSSTTTANPTPSNHSSSSSPTSPMSNAMPSPSDAPSPPHPLASLRAGPSRFPVVSRPAFVPPSRKAQSIDQKSLKKEVQNPSILPAEVVREDEKEREMGMDRNKARRRRPKLVLMATDPYTVPAYETRTGKKCLPLSFTDIAQGKLGDLSSSSNDSTTTTSTSPTIRPPNEFDLVICSFALHLVGDASEMFSLLYDLSRRSRWLAVIAPHKKPEIKEGWGYTRWNFGSWTSTLDSGMMIDGDVGDEEEALEVDGAGQSRLGMARDADLVNQGQEIVLDRVRCRLYRSVEV